MSKKMKLDSDERDWLDSFDKGEWASAKHLEHEKDLAKQAARNTLRKDARVNIRLSSIDLNRIK